LIVKEEKVNPAQDLKYEKKKCMMI